MTPDQAHEEVRELLGAYALDSVDRDEAAAVEGHLPGCPECQAEVDQHRKMAASLGTTVVPLPPNLWDRIADEIGPTRGADGGRRPAPFPVAVPSGSPGDPNGAISWTPRSPKHDRPTVRRRGPRRLAHPWALGAVVAASLAVIVLLSVGLIREDDRFGEAREALDGRASSAALQAAMTTPGHRLVSLLSPSGSKLAEIVVLPNGRGYLVSSSMPALSPGQTYQLWATFGSKAISLGLLGQDPASAAFTVASGHPTQLAVTVEPAGGVAVPDRPPLASGTIAT